MSLYCKLTFQNIIQRNNDLSCIFSFAVLHITKLTSNWIFPFLQETKFNWKYFVEHYRSSEKNWLCEIFAINIKVILELFELLSEGRDLGQNDTLILPCIVTFLLKKRNCCMYESLWLKKFSITISCVITKCFSN